MKENQDLLSSLKEIISKEKKTIKELDSLFNYLKNTEDIKEKNMFSSQIKILENSLKKTNENLGELLEKISLTKPLQLKKQIKELEIPPREKKLKNNLLQPFKRSTEKILKGMKLSGLEKETLKRLKKKEEKVVKKKEKKPSAYIKSANKFFSDLSRKLIEKKWFALVKRDLTKTNLQFTPTSYISLILFTTSLVTIAGFIIFLFLLFFNVGAEFPIITKVTEDIGIRFLKVFWVLFIIPIGTFLFMYFYPSLEKKSAEYQIDQELPFATIHMSAISGSLLEPSKIFSILISTKEYPYLEKEFTKLINEINIYGYDLVTALRNVALNTPSKKLAELFNSLATTITSGGNLSIFFNKRAQSLLFDYRLEREKYTKTAETFMDIYISVVIAAPMILMLLLMMMKISGLGISLSSSMITLIMVLGVTLVNIVFLTFLHLKQPKE
jgi:Flp pilus assembly protein TadB